MGVIDISSKEPERGEHRAERDELRNELFESSHLPIGVMEVGSYRIIDANQSAATIFGFSRVEELIGRTPFDFCPPYQADGSPSRERAIFYAQRALAQGVTVFEWRHMRLDGALWDAEVHLMRFAHRSRTLLQFTLVDITERKASETALRESEILHSAIVNSTSDLIWSVDPVEFRLLTFNRGLMEHFRRYGVELKNGYPPEMRHGQQEHAEIWGQLYKRALKEGAFSCEYSTFDNERVLELNFALLERDGKIFGISVFGRNITEQKRAETSLRERERTLATLMSNLPGLAYRCQNDLNWTMLFVSEGCLELTGYTPEELLQNREVAYGELIEPEDQQRVWQEVQRSLAEKGPWRIEYRIRTKTGQEKWVWEQGCATDASNYQILEGLIIDITQRKKAEQERQNLRAQLLQAQKMESIGQLAGGVAHDFNNMLGVILGETELLLMDLPEHDPTRDALSMVRHAAERSAELTRQLLAFARKQAVVPRVLELNETVSGMLKMMRRLLGEEIELIWRPGVGIEPVKIDPGQVDQLLANLCVNAKDAIGGVGKVIIETANAVFDDGYDSEQLGCAPGSYVMFAVSDNGAGMSKEVRERIFEPFFTTKAVGKGTGLGLSTVYGIVRQNDGVITVYSEPGQGTTFKIYLPQYSGPASESISVQHSNSIPARHAAILLVEDDESLLHIGKTMLERLGFSVLCAPSPSYALELASQHSGGIDLLMTDVILPEINGRDLYELLRKTRPLLRCLFVSGYTADVIAHHGVIDEGVNFLTKPFSLRTLSSRIGEVLGQPAPRAQ